MDKEKIKQAIPKNVMDAYVQIKQRILYASGSAKVVLSGKRKESAEYLKSIHNTHKGRCFIVCNGPSLTGADLDMIKDEVSFGCNRIYNFFGDTKWRPTYYVMFDEGVALRQGTVEGANYPECKMHFFRMEGYESYKKIKGPVCWLHSFWSRKYLDNPAFSLDLVNGVYSIASVTYVMLQVAVWMGFTEIYIVGADNSYSTIITRDGKVIQKTGQKDYFGNEKAATSNPIPTWEMDNAYEYAEKFSREHGFRIYNVTRGGYLEAFERENLEDVLRESR